MKKTLLALALVIASTTASAGAWEKLTTLGQQELKPTAEYTVDTAGWNIRVSEWTPVGNPNVRCMFAGGSKKGCVACYPVSHHKEVK